MGKASRHKHARYAVAVPEPAPAQVAGIDGRERLPALTGLRGVAALLVLGFHLHSEAGGLSVFSKGWVGVGIFFTLSGFLLALPLVQADGRFARPGRGYFIRRFARVLPAIWLQIGLLAVLAWLGWAGFLQWRGAADAALQFTLLFHLGPQPIQPWLSHWWTIPVELGFYLLLPLMLRAANRFGVACLLLVPMLAWSYRALLVLQFPDLSGLAYWMDNTLGRMDQFALGVLAARCCLRHGQRLTAWRLTLLAVGLALLAALLWLDFGTGYLVRPGWGVVWHGGIGLAVAALLVGLYLGDTWLGWVLSWRPLIAVGVVSYGLYLWHYPIIVWMQQWPWLAAQTGAGERQLLMLAVSLLAATASWWLAERPAQAWASRRFAQQKPAG